MSCWSGRNVGAVEVNAYTIEPYGGLSGADLKGVDFSGRTSPSVVVEAWHYSVQVPTKEQHA